MGFARRMAPQAPRVRTLTLAYTANPASAARWFARRSHVIPAKAGIYGSKGLDPRLRGDDGIKGGDELGFCGRWALPGEWRRRRPGEELKYQPSLYTHINPQSHSYRSAVCVPRRCSARAGSASGGRRVETPWAHGA